MDLSSTTHLQNIPHFWLYNLINQQENLLGSLNNAAPATNIFAKSKKFFLVQYSRHPQSLMQAVLTEKQVSWSQESHPLSPDVMVNDGQRISPGKLLFAHDNEDFLYSEFQKLKLLSFQTGFDENDTGTTIGPNTWILVLYTCHKANVVYSIINNRDTFHGIRNPYADVICYLNFGNNVYQAIIVRKSEDYKEVFEALNAIKNSCLQLPFPLPYYPYYDAPNAVPPKGFQSLCGTVEEFLQRSDIYAQSSLEASLKRLECRMRDDAITLHEWATSLEQIKKQAEEQKFHLEQLKRSTEHTVTQNPMEEHPIFGSPGWLH